MHNYINQFILIATLHLLALMSPGPDFIMITRSALIYGKRTGIYSSIGLALGVLVHLTYCLLGIAYVISKSIEIFSIIKILGGLYLIYIGYKSITDKNATVDANIVGLENKLEEKNISAFAAVRLGFLTNALNPKATLFFLSLFTQVIDNATPVQIKLFYGLEMTLATASWFSLVTLIFSTEIIKKRLARIQKIAERTMGVILIGLGLKIVLSKH